MFLLTAVYSAVTAVTTAVVDDDIKLFINTLNGLCLK
jgi:hypothetical protein